MIIKLANCIQDFQIKLLYVEKYYIYKVYLLLYIKIYSKKNYQKIVYTFEDL